MRQVLFAIVLSAALSSPLAAEAVEGYLVDKACSAKILKGGADAAKAHTKDCALSPDCKASGYGVVTDDGRFLMLDDDGGRMAAKTVGFSSRENNLRVRVDGKVKDGTIAVIAVQLL